MRLGRRLTTGVAEHPPEPERHEQPVSAADETVRAAEVAPAELVVER